MEIHDGQMSKMKENSCRGWKLRANFQESIISPRKKYMEHIAIFNGNTIGCGNGVFYHHTRNTWVKGYKTCRKVKFNGKTRDVEGSGNKLVVYHAGPKSSGEVFIYDGIEKSERKVELSLGTEDSTFLFCERDGEDQFYVSNQAESVVHQLDQNGKLIRNYGEDLLRYPYAMSLDSCGDLIASDWLLNDVIIFASNGDVKRRLGSNNGFTLEHQFNPYGLTVDKNGFVFVSSWRSDSVFVFSPQGDYLRTLLTKEDGLQEPTNITTTTDGVLLVVNSHGTEIRCFKYQIVGQRQ